MEKPQTEEPVESTGSVEDRIVEKFMGKEQPPPAEPEAEADEEGEEPTEEVEGDEAEQEEESEPELVEVELNGEKYAVSQAVKDAIMRESDYTKKTTELANTRRAIELQAKELAIVNEQRAFDQSVADDVDNLKMLEAYIKNVEQQTDWSRLNTDQIVRARLELDQYRNRATELRDTLGKKWGEFKGKVDAERQKLKGEMAEGLSKSIPGWSDETRGAIEKYAKGLGYGEVEVQNMRLQDYQIVFKAMQFDKLQAEKGNAVKQASLKKGKVVNPGPRKTMSDKTAQYLNFRKSMGKAKTPQERNAVIADRVADKFMGLGGRSKR